MLVSRLLTTTSIINGIVIATLFNASNAWAASTYPDCLIGQTCTVGEYLYADSGAPIADATCQLTSYTPTGQVLFNALPLPAMADGWYAHSFVPPVDAETGFHRSQLCCDTTENDLCIDKSFTITRPAPTPTPGLSAEDVTAAVWNASASAYGQAGSMGEQVNPSTIWNYSDRSLNNTGTLISNIWDYSTRSLNSTGSLISDLWNYNSRSLTENLTADEVWSYDDRSLTSMGSVVADVWSYNSRSLTSFGDLVSSIWNKQTITSSDSARIDVSKLEAQIEESRNLLDRLANSPTVDTYLEEDPGPKLESKLNQTKEYVAQIATNQDLISTKIGFLTLKWTTLSDTDVTTEIQAVLALLGTNETEEPKTIIGQLAWLKKAWDKPVIREVYDANVALRESLLQFQTTLQSSAKTSAQLELLTMIFADISPIKASIGDLSNNEQDTTLFGLTKQLRLVATNLEAHREAVLGLQTSWESLPADARTSTTLKLRQETMKLNQLPGLASIVDATEPKNLLDQLLALTNLNRSLMAHAADEPVRGSWVTPDAIFIKTVVHNPSMRQDQIAKIRVHLPKDITEAQINRIDPRLTVRLDPETMTLLVEGNIPLKPQETQVLDIRIADIWQIQPFEVDQLRNQVNELIKPLEHTALYPQATALKSSIDVALDTIEALQQQGGSPTVRIQTYHQAQILMTQVKDQITQLQGLVGQVSQAHSLKGYIGGAQALAAWGLIIIFIGGFVFLTLYMRTLYGMMPANSAATSVALPVTQPVLPPTTLPPLLSTIKMPEVKLSISPLAFRVSFLVLAAATVAITGLRVLPRSKVQPEPTLNAVTPVTLPEPTITPTPIPSPTPVPIENVMLVVPKGGLNVREEASSSSAVIQRVKTNQMAEVVDETDEWTQVKLIELDPVVEGWVKRELVRNSDIEN